MRSISLTWTVGGAVGLLVLAVAAKPVCRSRGKGHRSIDSSLHTEYMPRLVPRGEEGFVVDYADERWTWKPGDSIVRFEPSASTDPPVAWDGAHLGGGGNSPIVLVEGERTTVLTKVRAQPIRVVGTTAYYAEAIWWKGEQRGFHFVRFDLKTRKRASTKLLGAVVDDCQMADDGRFLYRSQTPPSGWRFFDPHGLHETLPTPSVYDPVFGADGHVYAIEFVVGPGLFDGGEEWIVRLDGAPYHRSWTRLPLEYEQP